MIKKSTLNILFVLGTRPEFIKLAPLISLLAKSNNFQVKVCSTGQHKEMIHSLLNTFDVNIDIDLDVMTDNQSLSSLSAQILEKIQSVLINTQPDLVVVQGDTTTAFIVALGASYLKIPVAHIEAGLRTGDFNRPFPEERNRVLISKIAEYHFAPTEASKQNLLAEGVSVNNVFVTGNTVIDALLSIAKNINWNDAWSNIFGNVKQIIDNKNKIILVTGHRRESFGAGFENICEALRQVALKYPSIHIVYPVHLNPNVQKPVNEKLSKINNIHLLSPLSYKPFIYLMQHAYLILTDSGGIQEEAPSLNKPVLVMRDTTERMEAVHAGTTKLVGTKVDSILSAVSNLIEDTSRYQSMANKENPYGDGSASQKIMTILEEKCIKKASALLV